LLALLLIGCAHAPPSIPAPSKLTGQPSWLPIGPEVYQERDVAQAEREVLTVRTQPRWFIGLGRRVTKDEFYEYLSRRSNEFSVQEQPDGKYSLPDPPPYPKTFDDLPVLNRGVRLSLGVGSGDDAGKLRLQIGLESATEAVSREVEHRWTNALPFLFAFYVDGAAVSRTLAGWGKDGGMESWQPLVGAGGSRAWNVQVDATSLRQLLPDARPHEVAVVAVFANSQHEPYDPDAAQMLPLARSTTALAPLIVRSEPVRFRWDGAAWQSGNAPPASGAVR